MSQEIDNVTTIVTEKQVNDFLLQVAGRQRVRISRLMDFIDEAEQVVLQNFSLDNLTAEQVRDLRVFLKDTNAMLLELLELIRKVAVKSSMFSPGNIDVDELAYNLSKLSRADTALLQQKLKEIKSGDLTSVSNGT